MRATGVVTLLAVGLILGGFGRFLVPGPRPAPMGMTMAVGLAAALPGTLFAELLDLYAGVELMFQVVPAALGVVLAANLYVWSSRRSASRRDTPQVGDGLSAASGPSGAPPRHDARPVSSPRPPPSLVFVSYRRTDGGGHAAGRIVDQLRGRLGWDEVFIDIDSLPAGVDFVDGVLRAIRRSAVVLVLIGDQWLTARLDDPDDTVRMEIETALQWGKHVLPVLVNGAAMPRSTQLPSALAPLSRLNGVPLRHESWRVDIERLADEVTRLRADGTPRHHR